MQENKLGNRELQIREFIDSTYNGEIPGGLTVQQMYTAYMVDGNFGDSSYGLFNGVIKKIRSEIGYQIEPSKSQSTVARATAMLQNESLDIVAPKVVEIGSMEFPEFKKYLTNTIVDQLVSDHDEEGGWFGGTATIVTGESGVGKSTVLLSILSKIKLVNPETKVLYISSEMTRNDLFFYSQKVPLIKTIPTILIQDYIMTRFDKTLEIAMNDQYDVILIDSYQDLIVKLSEVLGWKTTRAESWLIGLMIDASDKRGAAVIAIQHLTKSGQYVGKTYLKHVTQAMMEMRFDESGRRYCVYTKNRRGGSMVGKRMYFTLKDGDIVFDEILWNAELNASNIVNSESDTLAELQTGFDKLFKFSGGPKEEEHIEEADYEVQD